MLRDRGGEGGKEARVKSSGIAARLCSETTSRLGTGALMPHVWTLSVLTAASERFRRAMAVRVGTDCNGNFVVEDGSRMQDMTTETDWDPRAFYGFWVIRASV